jgi:formylglycine-generating enzyme required for sulfatase activity
LIGVLVWGIGTLLDGGAAGGNTKPTMTVAVELTQMSTPSLTATPAMTDMPAATDTPTPTSTPQATPTPTATPIVTRVREADRMVQVWVPEGSFEMGSEDGDPDADEHELPKHTVTLDGYWLDRTEVTNEQYAAFLNEVGNPTEDGMPWFDITTHPWRIRQHDNLYTARGYEDHPVAAVTWYGARAYCAWVGGRLPTEAEWEYAARGPEAHIYPWGNTFDGTRLNYCDRSCPKDWGDAEVFNDGYEMTAPVGSYPQGASWVGALDMAGNVSEWVNDGYSSDYYSVSPPRNPMGPGTIDVRVMRGGSWDCRTTSVRSAQRFYIRSNWEFNSAGFRCAMPQSP